MGISDSRSRLNTFRQIYLQHSWGGISRSGPGSDARNTRPYVRHVQRWLKSHPDVKRIVEIGCGDWETTRRLDLAGKYYTGIDIVPEIIQTNSQRFGSSSIAFRHCDFIDQAQELPEADVLIAKDVLQHLSNSAVLYMCANVLPRYRFAIVTNDWLKICWRWTRVGLLRPFIYQRVNDDIRDGESRPLRLSRPPFCLKADKTKLFLTVNPSAPLPAIYLKQIFIWKRNSERHP